MKPLTMLYWIRAVLGIVIGLLSTAYITLGAAGELASIYTFLTGVSFALLFYIATYYVVKLKFAGKVEKASKLMTQGIGIYFFAWLVTWTLLVTLFTPAVMVNIYNNGELADGQTFWVVARDGGGQVVRNVTTATGTLRMTLLSPGSYSFELGDMLENSTVEGQGQNVTLSWLQSASARFNVTG